MKYETPSLEVLLVDEELFMAITDSEYGDAGKDDSLDFGGDW